MAGAYLHRRHPEADIAVLAILRKLGMGGCDEGYAKSGKGMGALQSVVIRNTQQRSNSASPTSSEVTGTSTREATKTDTRPSISDARREKDIFPKPLLLRREGFDDYTLCRDVSRGSVHPSWWVYGAGEQQASGKSAAT